MREEWLNSDRKDSISSEDIKIAVNDGIKSSGIKRIPIIVAVISLIGVIVTPFISNYGERKLLEQKVHYTQTAEMEDKNSTSTQEYEETQVANAIVPGGKTPAVTLISDPTITPHPPTNTPIITASISPTPERLSPELFVSEYYDHLNNSEFVEAWNMLDEDLQAAMDISIHQYIGFWEITIPVSIKNLYIEEYDREYGASVIVTIYFERKGYSQSFRFGLVFEPQDFDWIIISVEDFP